MKPTFQDKQNGWFSQHSENKRCRKIKAKNTTVRNGKNVISQFSWTLEAYKSENGVETNCYKYKKKTIGVLFEWILTTRTAATTPRISIFTLSPLKIRAVFLRFPNVCLLISRWWKKISTNGFHNCKPHSWENLSLKYERYRTKLRYWKIVANEKCNPEYSKLSSVKNFILSERRIKKGSE